MQLETRIEQLTTILNKYNVEEINKKYPNKQFLDLKFTDYIIGDYQMTYSTQTKTSIFELIFRTKSYK